MGYSRAGFEVVGVDSKSQKHFPFEFHCDDAFAFLERHGHEFDVIHASPPCQAYTIMRNLPWLREKEYPRLIDPTREALTSLGKPYIIENVMGAKLPAGFLCGTMFGLPFYRHRAFETNWFWLSPPHSPHEFTIRNGRMMGARARDIVFGCLRRGQGHGAQNRAVNVGYAAGVRDARVAMELPYMSRDELSQAIPPAYTEWIGRRLLEADVQWAREQLEKHATRDVSAQDDDSH